MWGGASGASDKTKVRPNMNKKEAMRVKNDLVINTLNECTKVQNPCGNTA